ncbi:MAG: YgiQ family radical SAM protein [Lentisphaerae bacterium GWF2_45_14]|nr:MAG: YgiQ family radical SAM protein [Lentisphaerae bacterium GWF2_45_14]
MKNPDFLPMSREEMKKLGWDSLDVLLITGDAYVDHPSFGAALIGRFLLSKGWKTGIIAQPDWKNPESLQKMGTPRLACAVTSGNMDSMVNMYTAGRRLRKEDMYSPGARTGLRPPHAVSVYSQLARSAFPGTPVIAGGLEASLRRVAHYDYWQDKIRPSALVDSKADILVYGMGEKATETIMERLSRGESLEKIRGTAVFLGGKASKVFVPGTDYVSLPSYEELLSNPDALMESTLTVEREINPHCGKGLLQIYGERLLLIEPPAEPLSVVEMDDVYALPFSRKPHPSYKEKIPAFDAVKDSICAVRGCPGGCSFCGLVSHQGKFISSRSCSSILKEVSNLASLKDFKGIISDIGGAAGNIYASGPRDPAKCRTCKKTSCLFPSICPNFNAAEAPLSELLREALKVPGVRKIFINSGIRLDLACRQKNLMKQIVREHVSGHMKVAPEHLHPEVLRLMRKNPAEDFYKFMEFFEEESRKAGKEQYLIPLFISNFPGCTTSEMKVVDDFLNRNNWSPQQVQDYIPLPMTMAAAMYYTGKSFDGTPIVVNRGLAERREQIKVLKKKRGRPARRS